jgi:hypothetical protein
VGGAAGALADRIEDLLEGLARRDPADEQLADRGARVARDRADRRVVDGDVAPAEDALAVVHDRGLEDRLALAAPGRALREEHRRDGVVAGRRQRDAHGSQGCGVQLVRDLEEDARAVAGAGVAASGAAMG